MSHVPLITALRRAPRDASWLLRKGYEASDLPPETETAWQWTDHGWRHVYYIRPQRVSRRWHRILGTLFSEPSPSAEIIEAMEEVKEAKSALTRAQTELRETIDHVMKEMKP